MDQPSTELEELIVRALTGQHQQAKQALQDAANKDPEVGALCDDLKKVMNLLGDLKDWEDVTPNSELNIKLRKEVSDRLPRVTPELERTLLRADLGRKRAIYTASGVSIAALVILIFSAWMLTLKLEHNAIKPLKQHVIWEGHWHDISSSVTLANWDIGQSSVWGSDDKGLFEKSPQPGGSLMYKTGLPATSSCAINVTFELPDQQEGQQALLFLADTAHEISPQWDGTGLPHNACVLDVRAKAIILHYRDHFLHSSERKHSKGTLAVRMEYLGDRVRILLDNELFFDHQLSRLPTGPLYPGIQVCGPKKSSIRIKHIKLEQ